jgi:hypothetical protein
MGVLIDMLAAQPGIGTRHLDAKLLLQLTYQRVMRRFAGLDLAAGKFPITRIEGARRPLAQQELRGAVRRTALDDGGSNFGELDRVPSGFHLRGLACRPA